jgi:hypothetical protein
MTNGTQFFAQLKSHGWAVTEQRYNWKCVSPSGKVFLYKALQAVKFGTWHDVDAVNDVDLPSFSDQ